MKLFTGWVMSAGLVFTAAAANAQVLAPYEIGRPSYAVVSDVDGPYAGMPPEAAGPRYGPTLLPAPEVYTIVRESGFSPLGIPQQRGLVYTISVIDRGGDDGRLVIDARTGRIVRFMPAVRAVRNPVLREGLLWHLHCLTALPVLDLALLLRVTPARRDDAAVAVLASLYPEPAP